MRYEEMPYLFQLLPAALGAVMGSVLTLTIQEMIRYLRRPHIHIHFDSEKSEYCVRTPERKMIFMGGEVVAVRETESIWLRIKITNSGPSTARNCQTVISKMARQSPDGSWQRIDDQDSLPLQWSLRNRMTVVDLPKGINQFVDVCSARKEKFRIVQRNGSDWELLADDVSKKLRPEAPNFPFRLEKAWEGAGTFELEVVVTADHATPKRRSIKFHWGGSWDHIASFMKQR